MLTISTTHFCYQSERREKPKNLKKNKFRKLGSIGQQNTFIYFQATNGKVNVEIQYIL